MNLTALIFAIMLILGVSSYESKAEAASVDNAQLMIGWYEDRATPISEDNPYRTEILSVIKELDGAQQLERFNGAELPSGYVIRKNGEKIEFGAYDEDSLSSSPDVEGWVAEPGRNALYIKDNKELRLYDWEYYLELDTLAKNAQYKELSGKTLTAGIRFSTLNGASLFSEEYGEFSVEFMQPVSGVTGDVLEITVPPMAEEIGRGDGIPAQAVNLSNGNIARYYTRYAVPIEYDVMMIQSRCSFDDMVTDRQDLEHICWLYSEEENGFLTAEQAEELLAAYPEVFFEDNILMLRTTTVYSRYGSELDVFAMNAPWGEFLVYYIDTMPQRAEMDEYCALVVVSVPCSHWYGRCPKAIDTALVDLTE